MRTRVPSYFVLVPGPWRKAAEVAGALRERGIASKLSGQGAIRAGELYVDVVGDEQLGAGFSWGRQGPLPEDLLARVGACTHAALIECGQRLEEDCARIAKVGRALRDAGGVAVRMEASGAASAWEPWLDRMESGAPFDVYASAVSMVQDDEGLMFTCGMHQFDLPDAQVVMSEAREAIDWLDSFCVYQLAERPALASGHTFAPHDAVVRRAFERWPDHRHHHGDGRHNPFGVWRFREPGVAGLEAGSLIPTIMPPLVAQLLATERSQGRALTQREVADLVSNSAAVAMQPRDVLALERSRGYADIEPELAWEQWQIVRSAK